MIKINLTTKETTRDILPTFLKGLKQESLNDLSWTDEALGLQGFGFWQEQDISVIDNTTEVFDGTETYTLDEPNFVVKVTKGVRLKTQEELDAEFKATVPSVITMRQARLALLQSDLLTTVTDAISNGTDEALKVEWEYATECEREWPSLVAMATSLGMTERQLDDLFILGATL